MKITTRQSRAAAGDKQGVSSGGGHTTDSYHDTGSDDPDSDDSGIFSIESGKPGAIEPRSDKPN